MNKLLFVLCLLSFFTVQMILIEKKKNEKKNDNPSQKKENKMKFTKRDKLVNILHQYVPKILDFTHNMCFWCVLEVFFRFINVVLLYVVEIYVILMKKKHDNPIQCMFAEIIYVCLMFNYVLFFLV